MDQDIFRPNGRVRPAAARIYDHMQAVYRNRRTNPNWEGDEIIALWEITNRERAMLGKGPIPLAAVKDQEIIARGSIDYAAKCAYYCDDLVREVD